MLFGVSCPAFRGMWYELLTASLSEPHIIRKLHSFKLSSLLFSSFIGVLAKTGKHLKCIINNKQKENVTGN
jgi:hypothetical protein